MAGHDACAGTVAQAHVRATCRNWKTPVLGFWAAAPSGAQEIQIENDPVTYYRPPYVGHRGWIGVRLDVPVDWDEIGARVREAYAVIARR
jgi:hypothetical protein